VEHRFCAERGSAGFSWIVEEPATRTSHALAADGRMWLVDPVDWPEAIERAMALGKPAAVLQLLDRHNRSCATLADRLGIPHVVVPDTVASSPFACIPVKRTRRWAETALWWREMRTLVVAEALGTNSFYTGGRAPVGVHLLLRLSPPTTLGGLGPEQLLVGHGEGISGPATPEAIRLALVRSRRDLPRVVSKLPALAYDAWRRRSGR
jgi:hypothetical protein